MTTSLSSSTTTTPTCSASDNDIEHNNNDNNLCTEYDDDSIISNSCDDDLTEDDSDVEDDCDNKSQYVSSALCPSYCLDDLHRAFNKNIMEKFQATHPGMWCWRSLNNNNNNPVLHHPLEYNLSQISLGMFPATSATRLYAVRISDARPFRYFILFVIFINSVCLALEPPTITDTQFNHFLEAMDVMIIIVFTVELALKVVAMGLYAHRKSFLRDPSNVLDAVIVASGIVSLCVAGEASGVAVLRVIRLLRPLRTINRVKGLRVILSTLVSSMSLMRDVFVLLLLLLYGFAVFGLHLWSGTQHQRCHVDNRTVSWLVLNDTDTCGVGRSCSENGFLARPQTCVDDPEHPVRSVFNFDHFGNSLLLVLKVTSLDNWVDDMANAANSSGSGTAVYFVLVSLFGGFVCLNLVIAVLCSQFHKEGDLLAGDQEAETARRRQRTPANFIAVGFLQDPLAVTFDAGGGEPREASAVHEMREQHRRRCRQQQLLEEADIGCRARNRMNRNPSDEVCGVFCVPTPKSSTLSSMSTCSPITTTTAAVAVVPLPPSPETDLTTARVNPIAENDNHTNHRRFNGWAPLRTVVCTRWFRYLVLAVTLLNAIILSLDHYGMNSATETVIAKSSICFTVFFLAELCLKLGALGPKRYACDAYNWLDAVLCVVSIPDLVGGGGSSFTALRALRIFRALRLARNWKNLQRLLRTMGESVKSVAFLSLIMTIFIYIFAILGFQVFGDDMRRNRGSFRSVFDSVLTVIVIISGETWADDMEDMMGRFGYHACLYFIALTVLGNFIFVNLFIAIILQHFSNATENDRRRELDELEKRVRRRSTATAVVASPMSKRQGNNINIERNEPGTVPRNPLRDRDYEEGGGGGRTTEIDNADPVKALPSETRAALLDHGTDSLPSPTVMEGQLDALRRFSGDLSRIRGVDSIAREAHTQRTAVLLDRGNDDDNDMTTLREMRAYAKMLAMNTPIKSSTTMSVAPLVPLTQYRFATFGNKRGRMSLEREKNLQKELNDEKARWRGTEYVSLGCLHSTDRLRRTCITVLQSRGFDGSLFIAILLSCLFLSLDTPDVENTSPKFYTAIHALDIIMGVVFTLEAMMKVVALGAYQHPGAYFRSIWNILDFIVVVTSYLAIVDGSFRIARVLRVVRLLSSVRSMRLVLTALVQAVPSMTNVAGLGALLWWIFGIVGVSLFKGSL
eukprot:PhM_4_TR11707/c5_g1_i1/m.86071/K04852/CACNA1E; voltage-dependent calcium channel R type alpha-1E